MATIESSQLRELLHDDEFVFRHIGMNPGAQSEMCEHLGVNNLGELIDQVVPVSIRTEPNDVRPAHTEADAIKRLQGFADRNRVFKSYIGAGYYNCHTPAVILRNILQNPAWYTAYTPYQPEISQGRLEALLNFQTMVSDLTGLEIANASLLDEATAAAEAMTLCARVSKNKSRTFFVSNDVHPHTLAVLKTRAIPIDVEIIVGDDSELAELDCFGALFQYPGTSGAIRNFDEAIKSVQSRKGLAVVAADLLSLTLLRTPGEMGADIAIGSTQRFGVPLFYGGPHAAYMSTSSAHKRALPGRLIGVSVDSQENPALRMALQTREQHIRRDKATSNICTAQALLAITAGMYATYHGPEGLTRIARRVHRLTSILASGLAKLGYNIANSNWFDTLTVDTGEATDSIHSRSVNSQINFRHFSGTQIGVSIDETTTPDDIQSILDCFAADQSAPSFESLDDSCKVELSAEMTRDTEFLTHPVFHKYRTETEMLRYLRQLADKDLALDRTMIPLGSCTMKLNATTEMTPVTWPEFANIHPFAPSDQTEGYAEMITELEQMLCEATGYDAVSLQPNAGSQGEFAGLLAIQAYHASRGDEQRDVCLIPESAHGTNPASAKMAGLRIVVVKCDKQGNVDLKDLTIKADQHAENLSCMMITYPSTHGVFEENVRELCQIIHDRGGQVYIDGANLNAQVGLCQPGQYGGDVSHLNLHKTFCIPHGGGGPGVGPVAVRSHLAEFLPGHAQLPKRHATHAVGPVSAAPWGSAGILPISWTYIYLMGDAGLRHASECAILGANYIASRLDGPYEILYKGDRGRVAHECIIDLRPLKDLAGISADDVAKRLIDYGFHAPTMSFPVAGTLMIEPTESESKEELDRFCDAMLAIREEIQAVADGSFDQEDNPLVGAPHTAIEVTSDNWTHSYSRQQAAYPVASLRNNKYWPPVGRLNHAYGDRNIMCSCPEPAEYEAEMTKSS